MGSALQKFGRRIMMEEINRGASLNDDENPNVSAQVFSGSFLFLLGSFTVYLAIPLYEVPLFGLSISAPLFLFMAWRIYVLDRSGWRSRFKGWFLLAFFIWLGIVAPALANGITSGGTAISTSSYISIIRFAYWLLVFVSMVYISSRQGMLEKIAIWLGWTVLVLGGLRLAEYFFSGVLIGSGLRPAFFTQNFYGTQFSIFTPFAIYLLAKSRTRNKLFVGIGLVGLIAAILINGSRGSWVSIGVGTAILMVFLFARKPSSAMGLGMIAILIAIVVIRVYDSDPNKYQPIVNRYQTLNRVEEDKSYATRLWLNAKSLALFSDSPLIGVGTGNYTGTYAEVSLPSVIYYQNLVSMNTRSSHNSYLSFLAENGLFGTLPFGLLLLILSVMGLRATWFGLGRSDLLPLFVLVAFLQMSTHYWVVSGLTGTVTWFIYGLVAGLSKRQ